MDRLRIICYTDRGIFHCDRSIVEAIFIFICICTRPPSPQPLYRDKTTDITSISGQCDRGAINLSLPYITSITDISSPHNPLHVDEIFRGPHTGQEWTLLTYQE